MPVIAVTGHLDLAPATCHAVRTALDAYLAPYPAAELTGASCLAPGADTLFADAVLAHGARLIAVLPGPDYPAPYATSAERAAFDRLRAAAAQVLVLPAARLDPAAYVAANHRLLLLADRVLAVWDGRPGNGPGGTADMVATARTAGLPVDVLWPPGSTRTGGRRS
ncbi:MULTISPECIES: hypothetical protein [Kitasatospora]|uniref:Uncharacterized protein n=1 Tax=Kitasatospora setae (strain ATCC 33774 / DSM 43861 / JCM 3304 / KCC A-0304 / NBRC 14216 / KM-6054) TaxID=452652 RepID=E4NFF3_KITSK|nr:hypothetical protein [Kitasatospora setae]BAJ30233.1 hypothetical protein KSE_44500 [Kitasatospora setae KM-6054]